MKQILLSFVVLFVLTNYTKAQCTIGIANLPDTLRPCKNSVIQLTPTVYISSGNPYMLDTTWNTSVGLSDSNIINPYVTVGTTPSNYVLTVGAVTPTNLIANGDFSLGDALFTSAYIPGTGGTWGLLSSGGQYAITTNPNLVHTNFATFGDHTSGTGNMMVMNGAWNSNTAIWCQTIAVSPNTWYDFSAWGASCVTSAPAILQFSINGTLTGTPLALPSVNGQWVQFHTTWFSGTNTSIDICIHDQQTAASGNDFAIDDISFKELCYVSDSVYIEPVNLSPNINAVYHFGCTRDTVNFFALDGSGNIPSSYSWSFGDGFISSQKNPTHIYPIQGNYSVKLITEKNGCKDSSTFNVSISHESFANLLPPTPADTFACIGKKYIPAISSFTNNVLIAEDIINWGDGTIQNYDGTQSTNSHSYTNVGTYTLMHYIKDNIGCTDTAKLVITVLPTPYVDFDFLTNPICVGQSVQLLDTISQPYQSIEWNFGDGTTKLDIRNPNYVYNTAGFYNVSLVGKNNQCISNPTVKSITVNDYPTVNLGSDTSICPNVTGNIILTNLNASAGINEWNTGEISNSITVTQPGYYWVTVTNGNCATTDTIQVKRDCYINIPNSFSPNGDGVNDYFLPRDLLSSGLVTFKMSIYNRWGEQIYYTNKLDGRGWDGKYGGKTQMMDTYVYTIDVVFKNGTYKNFKGNVTLVR